MLENREGQKVPEVTFKVIDGVAWKEITTKDLFSGKKVVVFSLPGAFTPTCSTNHLPRYNELFETFKKKGVDSILCISVNDTFVMNSWVKDQGAPNITMVPDGNGEFSEKMGMLVDKSAIGFGKRSWRYSMFVDNGVIKKMFVEPEKEGDPYEVSDADTMMNYLDPNAKTPEGATIFTKQGCPHCAKAKAMLTEHRIPYEECIVDKTIPSRALRAMTGETSVPQVFMGGKRIGGADALAKHLQK